jgi:hypothetical protein
VPGSPDEVQNERDARVRAGDAKQSAAAAPGDNTDKGAILAEGWATAVALTRVQAALGDATVEYGLINMADAGVFVSVHSRAGLAVDNRDGHFKELLRGLAVGLGNASTINLLVVMYRGGRGAGKKRTIRQ